MDKTSWAYCMRLSFFFTFVVPGWIVPLTGLRFPFWYSERKCPDMAGIDKEAAPIMRIRIFWSDLKRDVPTFFFTLIMNELRGCGSDYFGQIQKETGADIFFLFIRISCGVADPIILIGSKKRLEPTIFILIKISSGVVDPNPNVQSCGSKTLDPQLRP